MTHSLEGLIQWSIIGVLILSTFTITSINNKKHKELSDTTSINTYITDSLITNK